MNEHSYIKSVHRHIPPPTYTWKINDNYAGGVADAYYCDSGGSLFVEYKYVPKVPKRGGTVVVPALSALQTRWLQERLAQNVVVAVVLGTPNGGIVFTERSWETGILREELDQYALSTMEVARAILDHCIGNTHVYSNDQTYPNCRGSRPSQTPEGALDAA